MTTLKNSSCTHVHQPRLSVAHQGAVPPSAISCGTASGTNLPEEQANAPASKMNVGSDKTWSLDQCKKRQDELLKAYENAIKSGKVKRTQSALWAYLRSYAVRVAAAHCVIEDLKSDQRSRGRMATEDPHVVAKQIKWNEPIKEPAYLWFKKKSSGGHRPIFDLGVVRRTACEVLRPILAAHLEPQPFQCDVRGKRGMQAAIRFAKRAILNGHQWVEHIDIENHFKSFDRKKLYTVLPLPKAVIDYVVVARDIPVVSYGDGPILTASVLREARRGIPQGSPISSLVAQFVTSKLARSHVGKVSMTNFADNFCVLGNSASDVHSATEALGAAIAALPGGNFIVKHVASGHLKDGLEFLGHRLKLDGDKLVVAPSEPNEKKYRLKLREYEHRLGHLDPAAAKNHPSAVAGVWNLTGNMWVFAKSWVGAFSECTTLDGELDAVKIVATEHLRLAGLDFSDIEGYENPDAEWDGDLYES